MRHRRAVVLGLAAVLTGAASVGYAVEAQDPEQSAVGRTPPRLSFVDGQASFWRPGAQDWAQAQVNTALAPGDELYIGSPGSLELQIGSRAFVRAWAGSQLGLLNEEPDFLQFKVTAGHASFDLRTLEPGRTVEVDTPNAAFTIEHTGYYRVDVSADRTSFISRRGGRATVTPANGQAAAITPSEEVVVEGMASPTIASYVAPPLDDWDRWNYGRTDALVDAVSARYVSPGVYGARDLDQYGNWRVVPTYGAVWVPTAVPVGWAPYSTGTWILDPSYGWTWVDTAPWGWAPYHYGRWVFVNGFWAWAPGPVVVGAVYAPALVAFFGVPEVQVTVPVVGWVALGWGEPLVPWWGPVGFVHVPWWGGWGGPHIVNNVVINKTTVVNVQNITVYQNASVQKAVVVMNQSQFGHGPIARARVTHVDVKTLKPIHTPPQVKATPASFVPTASRGTQPPKADLARPVVATRAPRAASEPAASEKGKPGSRLVTGPPPRLVSPPKAGSALASPRPPFGRGTAERPTINRPQPPSPPRIEGRARPAPSTESARRSTRPAPSKTQPPGQSVPSPPGGQAPGPPQVTRPSPVAPRAPSPLAETPRPAGPRAPAPRAEGVPARPLPGEPANRLSPTRSPVERPHGEGKAAPRQGPESAPEHGGGKRQPSG